MDSEGFKSIDCARCGIVFKVRAAYMQNCREDKRTFYCPNQHPNIYGDNEADKLKKRIEEKDLVIDDLFGQIKELKKPKPKTKPRKKAKKK